MHHHERSVPPTDPRRRRVRRFTAAAVAVPVGALALWTVPSQADDPVPPEPPSTGTEIPQTYFGPPASESFSENNESLVGPVELLKAGTTNSKAGTTTLPLYLGHDEDGTKVWFILTDTTDQDNADALGLNFSAKLGYANVGDAVREAWLQPDTSLLFETGAVDLSPRRVLVPGEAPNAFPPKVARPGSVGDASYTPYVEVVNAPGTPIYNAPVVAYDVTAKQLAFCKGDVDHSLVQDRVVKICPKATEQRPRHRDAGHDPDLQLRQAVDLHQHRGVRPAGCGLGQRYVRPGDR